MLLGPPKPDMQFLAALESIQGWTRQRFKLAPDAAVLVSEVRCRIEGCPPLETVVAFWTGNDKRHQFKVYKPVSDVVYDDLGWLIGSPTDHEGMGWDCC